MERLTEKHYNGDGYYMKCSETCPSDCSEICDCEELDRIVDRLGAIEDILGDDYDLDQLRERMRDITAADHSGGTTEMMPSVNTPWAG